MESNEYVKFILHNLIALVLSFQYEVKLNLWLCQLKLLINLLVRFFISLINNHPELD